MTKDLTNLRIDRKERARIMQQDIRPSVPSGQFHVDAQALKNARRNVPKGEFHVDAKALQAARRNVPKGEFHA